MASQAAAATDSALPASSEPPIPVAAAWRAVAIFFGIAILLVLDRQILGVLVDPVRHDLGISDTKISLLQGASFAIFYTACGLPLGIIADRTNRLRLIASGVAFWSAATIMCGFAPSFGYLFVGRMLVGMGEATLAPAVISMLPDMLPPRNRGRGLSVFLMGQALGGGVSILVTGLVLELVPHGVPLGVPVLGGIAAWRLVFILCGALGFLALLMLAGLREPQRTGDRLVRQPGLQLRPVLSYLASRWTVFVPMYLGFAGLSVVNYGMQAWAPSLMIRVYRYSPGEVARWLGGVSLVGAVIGAVLGGLAADRLGRGGSGKLRLVVRAVAFCLPGTLVGVAPNAGGALVMIGFWSAAYPVIGTIFLSAIQDMVPNDMRGLCASLVSFSNAIIGLSLGSFLIALCTDTIYRDPLLLGLSMTTVTTPAVLCSAGLFWAAKGSLRRER